MTTLKHLSQRYLDLIYQQKKPYHLKKTDPIQANYGEILPQGLNKLLKHIHLTKQDIFFDLGSGVGRVSAQVFLQTNVQESHGIEYLSELHQQAYTAAQRIQTELPVFYESNRKLNFILGDFLRVPFTQATVVLINATCFPPTLLRALAQRINQMPQLHTVICLRPLPQLTLAFTKAIRIECSWDSALCYLYTTKTKKV